jgi:hypothetical protein
MQVAPKIAWRRSWVCMLGKHHVGVPPMWLIATHTCKRRISAPLQTPIVESATKCTIQSQWMVALVFVANKFPPKWCPIFVIVLLGVFPSPMVVAPKLWQERIIARTQTYLSSIQHKNRTPCKFVADSSQILNRFWCQINKLLEKPKTKQQQKPPGWTLHAISETFMLHEWGRYTRMW